MNPFEYLKETIGACLAASAREARCMQLQLFTSNEGRKSEILRVSIFPDRADQLPLPRAEPRDIDGACQDLVRAMNEVAASHGGLMKQFYTECAAGMVTVRVRLLVAPEQMEFTNVHADPSGGAAAARAMFAGKEMPPRPEVLNRPTRTPDIEGRLARCWRLKEPPDAPPDNAACIGGYLVEAPYAHPMWSHWMITAVHLRDLEGVRPALKRFEGAEYEFMIWALDPGKALPDVDGQGVNRGSLMQPAELVHQVAGGVTDEMIGRVLEDVLRAITLGVLSPDSDYREIWKQVLDATVGHYRAGVHRLDQAN